MSQHMAPQLNTFIVRLRQRFSSGNNPSPAEIAEIAEELAALCKEADFDAAQLPAAAPGKEVLHALDVGSMTGASAYLVSDGVGVTSPPHEHQTWAVIVGIRGTELNTTYRSVQGSARQVEPESLISVGAREVLTLGPSEIHSTSVMGDQPTYHVHLYGMPLSALPPFASRCFEVLADDSCGLECRS